MYGSGALLKNKKFVFHSYAMLLYFWDLFIRLIVPCFCSAGAFHKVVMLSAHYPPPPQKKKKEKKNNYSLEGTWFNSRGVLLLATCLGYFVFHYCDSARSAYSL